MHLYLCSSRREVCKATRIVGPLDLPVYWSEPLARFWDVSKMLFPIDASRIDGNEIITIHTFGVP